MDQKNFFSVFPVRQVESDPPVEASRPQKRRIKHIGTVGGRHDNDLLIGLETDKFDENLIESLLALVITTANSSPSHPANRIHLADEDNGRSRFLGQVEEVAY